MFVGGLRALLLQSLHPLAMAGVADHSDYRGDPWGRLQRTSTFLAVTTFGPAADAQRAVDRIRGIHQRVREPLRTAAHTTLPTRTCWNGCTSPRSTASCLPTGSTERARWTRVVATDTWPTPPASRWLSAYPTRREASANCTTSSRTFAPSCAAPLPHGMPPDFCYSLPRCRSRRGFRTGCWPLRRGDAAGMGANAVAAALLSACRGHCDPDGGARGGRWHPLGHDGMSTRWGRVATPR